eukprot:TRINITY_DN2202_c0_g1_i2.p1 TRINITY_DN2202_c0_g1~~TRINITY_DN2202_c0_g1_i2.p1  ORF type:complete len:305 (+),score=115.41 TRINITY_DN2202_c0_g1_i2:67-981(+)
MAEHDQKQDSREFYMIWGKNGWIAGMLADLLTKQGKQFRLAESRMENRESVAAELDEYKPTHVLNCAGVTGRPNVDWCEDNKEATLRSNVLGVMTLTDLCWLRGIHVTLFATGCIYSYDADHPLGGKGFVETDKPNFAGSFYSFTKGVIEPLLNVYSNILILRLRMPISDDLSPRNFITKISRYQRVVNIPNSMSVLTELLPVSLVMAQRNLTGVYNFTNPGVISHNEILDLYKQYIDPNFTYVNFTEEEQALVLKAGRSNNCLDTTKLQNALPDITIAPIQEAIHGVFKRMRVNLGLEQSSSN